MIGDSIMLAVNKLLQGMLLSAIVMHEVGRCT
jgi:hypothetical protein